MEKTFCCESLYDDSEECNWSGDYDYCNNQAVMDSRWQQFFSCGDHESVSSEGKDPAFICKKTPGQGCNGQLNWGEIFIRKILDQSEESCIDNCRIDEECKDFVLTNGGSCFLFRGQCDDKFNQNDADYYECLRETTEESNVSCPECWELNGDKTACVLSDTTCFDISCDGAKFSFSFFPKMFGQSDLKHDFGVTGLVPKVLSEDGDGKFVYSKGFGSNGQEITVDGDEMIFSVKIETQASEDRLVEEIEVDGTKLVVQTGKLEFAALEVNFQCRVPLVTEVVSNSFSVNSDDDVKNQQLGGDKLVSLTGDLKPTFSLSLFKDASYKEAISGSNLKLGDNVYFTLKWSNTENDQIQFFAQDCQIVDGKTEVAIIKDTCLAGVVETTRLGSRHDAEELKFSYKSFAVDQMPAESSKTQTLKCSLKLCKNNECTSNMTSHDSYCPTVSGFTYRIA